MNTQSTLTAPTPTSIIDELIRRTRWRADEVKNPFETKFPDVSDEQLLTAVDAILAQEARGARIMPSHGTTVACTVCGRLNAPAYYLKRSHGRYAVLCFDGGQGCWEHSANSACTYVDQHSTQCMDLAEWVVAYGPDMLKERHVCSIHVPAVLSDVSEHRIYPLED